MNEIYILGTRYTYEYKTIDEDEGLKGLQGYCDFVDKKIILRDDDASTNEVLRHEIVHAFLFESGLDGESWAREEEIVDWIALQFPKLLRAFTSVDALDVVDNE